MYDEWCLAQGIDVIPPKKKYRKNVLNFCRKCFQQDHKTIKCIHEEMLKKLEKLNGGEVYQGEELVAINEFVKGQNER